jgi:hypothetical protein
MPRPRSLIVSMEITVAGNSHNCRFNDNHRIAKGMRRLTIKSDGDKHHYCLACAKGFLVKDVERLQTILTDVENALTRPAISLAPRS